MSVEEEKKNLVYGVFLIVLAVVADIVMAAFLMGTIQLAGTTHVIVDSPRFFTGFPLTILVSLVLGVLGGIQVGKYIEKRALTRILKA
jgi:hypothetical protein